MHQTLIARALAFVLFATAATAAAVTRVDIDGPAGSVSFGDAVYILPNGNIVLVDPDASSLAPAGGAVYLYRPDGSLISTVRGGKANDRVGAGGIRVLANGNFVIESPYWANGAA